MELGDAVGDAAQAQGGERVVELVVLDAGDLADLLLRDVAEEARSSRSRLKSCLLVAGLLRGVGGEDEALLHLLQAVVFLVEVEGGGEAVGLVEVLDVGVDAEFVEQAGAAGAEDDVLGDAAEVVVVVEAVGDRAG